MADLNLAEIPYDNGALRYRHSRYNDDQGAESGEWKDFGEDGCRQAGPRQ